MLNNSSDPSPRGMPAMTREKHLQTAMQVTDVIRRHEAATSAAAAASPSTDSMKNDDPLQPLRNFLDTPGVMQGCMVATVCLGVFVPARRLLLRIADQQWKLGTIFPDLVLTPTMAVATAQCSLWAGSVYGSAAYLQRLAEIAANTTTTQSLTVDAICNDAITGTATATILESRRLDDEGEANFYDNASYSESKTSSDVSWDPREQTINALQRALKACRERREYQERYRRDDEEV